MSRKEELKKQIAEIEKEINELEQKRLRSQSVIIEAFIDKVDPPATDAEYFKTLTSIINLQREKLQMLVAELESL